VRRQSPFVHGMAGNAADQRWNLGHTALIRQGTPRIERMGVGGGVGERDEGFEI